jgi:hypothetical protein
MFFKKSGNKEMLRNSERKEKCTDKILKKSSYIPKSLFKS